jgi:lysozyme
MNLLLHDLKGTEDVINHSVNIALEQHEFDPLCSLVFNIGPGAAGPNGKDGFSITKNGNPSMILAALNSGDKKSAADHFLDWRFAGGEPVLLPRRMRERAVFVNGS